MKLKDSLRAVFRNEEGLFDLATTDMDKTIEFAKGDFKRFSEGGGVADRYSSYGSYGTSSEFKANNRNFSTGPTKADTTNYSNYQSYSQSPKFKSENFNSYQQYAKSNPAAPREITNYATIDRKTARNIGYTGMLKSDPPAKSPSLWERFKAGADVVLENETVKKVLANLVKQQQDGGGPPDPFENMKKFKDSAVRARTAAGAQFRKGRIQNTPLTSKLAGAFNPNVSPSLAKFLMANMGTQGVDTKGLASFTDRISVRRPKYVSDTVTPQQVNFTLPTRT